MKPGKRILLMTAAAAIAFAGGTQTSAWAVYAGPPDGGAFIARLDVDGDGLVSAEEFDGDTNLFAQLDQDADGYIDAGEAPHHPPQGPPEDAQAMIDRFDADGDGALSADEFAGPLSLFDGLDSDGDGLLSEAELDAGSPGPPADGGFAADDTDQDGQVSLAEFSGPEDLFSQLDADGDGYITRDEVGPPPMGAPGDRPAPPQSEVN